MAEAAIGLGSNMGDKAAALEAALKRLEATPGIRVVSRSRLYRTEPWGDADQDFYLNACALIETSLVPRELLQRCMDIEIALGRDRARERRWGPRTADLDILFYGALTVEEPGLTLPHPHMFERAFVLVPLSEIAPRFEVNGRRVGDAARELDASSVSVWEGT